MTVQLVRAPSRELVAMLENTETGLVTITPEISGHTCGGQCTLRNQTDTIYIHVL